MRAALYFAVGSIEAFLNRQMRLKMTADGDHEDKIYDRLRYQVGFLKKAQKWPSEIAGCEVAVPETLLSALDEFNKLRGDVTHDKRRDHSLYLELDAVVLQRRLVPSVAEYLTTVMVAKGESYPYWVHGWNIIGMNGNPEWPICDNNVEFVHSLRRLGFRTEPPLVTAEAWERSAMRSLDTFRRIDANLRKLEHCQPEDSRFPMMGRLCRRWWDTTHVYQCGKPQVP